MSSNLKVNSLVPATGTEIGIGTTGGSIDFRCPATFGGNVTIGGTLTYDEVINIDSIGVITARSNIDCNGSLDVDGHTDLDNVSIAGVTTSAGIVQAAQFKLLDNAKAVYGSSADMEIYHNATNSLIQNGTGSLQIITTTGDLFLRGQDNITFNTAGNNERLRIDSSGRVMMGTTAASTLTSTDDLTISTSGSTGITLFSGTGYAGNITFGDGTSGDDRQRGLLQYHHSDNSMRFFTNAVRRMTIASNGNIGIATDNPQDLLHIQGSSNTNLRFTGNQIKFYRDSGSSFIDQYGTGDISFRTTSSTTERLLIKSNGNIGMGGNTNPTNVLHIKTAVNNTAVATIESTATNSYPFLRLKNDAREYQITCHGVLSDAFTIYDGTAGSHRFLITSDGQIGVNNSSPDAWHPSYRSIQIHDAGVLYGSQDDSFVGLGANHYLNTSGNFIYSNSDFASRFYNVNGEFYFEGAASGTAGNSFSFTQRLRITSTGQIRIDQATSANNGIRMRPSGWNYDFRMGAVSSSGGSIWLGQNYEPTTNTRDSASYGTNYLRFTTQGEIMLGTGATNTNPGQRIKIKSNGHTGINANDPQTTLNVIGTISTGRNVAREVGTVISQSGNYSGSRAATNVINGNKNYEYGYDWLVGPSSGTRTNAYLVIDLGSAYTCDRFVIYNQNEYDHSNREVKNFTLEGSNDNSSWTTLLDDDCGCSHGHEPNPGFSFRLPEGNVYGVDDNEGVSYRYWRFTMKTFHGSDSYGGVTELELYEVGDTTVSANRIGSEITTSSLVAGDISTQRMNGIQMLTSSEGLNIHTGVDASDTWEITETGIITNGSYEDKSTIRHKRGVMAVSSSYNSGDLFIRIDNLYNLPGNAWWVCGLLILSNEIQGGQGGGHHYVTSLQLMGLSQWSSVSKQDIVGSMTVSMSNYGSNFAELFINVNDSSRGPCTVICNGGTFDPPRISFH